MTVHCPQCRIALAVTPDLIGEVVQCYNCGLQFVAQEAASPPMAPQEPARYRPRGTPKSPGLAAVLSFIFPGLGQVCNGQIGKGLGLVLLNLLLGLITGLTVGIGLIAWLPFWIWVIYDAHAVAERHNRRIR